LDPSSYSLIDQKLRPVENIEKEEKARRILWAPPKKTTQQTRKWSLVD
jgi:hypothetical protein